MSTPGVVLTARRVLAATLLDSAVILDRTVVATAGGRTETWTARPGPPVPCRFGRVTDEEAEQAAGLAEGRAATAVTFGVGTVVAERAKVRNAASGREWLVVANLTPESVWQTAVRVLLREV